MKLHWDPAKNEKLIATRNISFEEIEQAIDNGFLLDVLRHPKRANQVYLVVLLNDYVWAVPAIPEEEGFFLKTAFADRKLKKRYTDV